MMPRWVAHLLRYLRGTNPDAAESNISSVDSYADFQARLADEARRNQAIDKAFDRVTRGRIERALPPLPTAFTRKAGRIRGLR